MTDSDGASARPATHQRAEPLFILDPVPTRGELALRALFGVLAGVALATYASVRLRLRSPWAVGLTCLALVTACVYGAMKYGDAFWAGLGDG